MTWKKTRQVFQTAGAPPSSGNTILAIIGSTRNIKNALTNSVVAKSATSTLDRAAARAPVTTGRT